MSKKIVSKRYAEGAIQIFDGGARIALLTRQKGQMVVADLIEVSFPRTPSAPEPAPSVKAAAIRDALKERGWQPGRMTLVLPKNIVTMRLVSLPSEEDAELAEMARYEAQKHIPFNVERHVISHAVLRRDAVEGSQTLIVAVDHAALDEPLAVCREAKIELTAARVSSLALVEALLFDPPADFDERTFALVDIGWATVDITIVSGGIVHFTRSGSMGVDRIAPLLEEALGPGRSLSSDTLRQLDAINPDMLADPNPPAAEPQAPTSFVVDDFADDGGPETEAQNRPRIKLGDIGAPGESTPVSAPPRPSASSTDITKWLDRIVQEIERTYTFAAREFECPKLEVVYIAGAGSYIRNIDRYLEEQLETPVERLAPPATLGFETRNGENLKTYWDEYAVAIGAAAGGAISGANLLPVDYIEKLAARRRRRTLAITGALFFLLIVAGAAYGIRWYSNLSSQLEELQTWNRKARPVYEELRDEERRIDMVERIIEDEFSASAVLEKIATIEQVNPTEPIKIQDHTAVAQVTLTEYQYVKGQGVTLIGHALSYTDLTNFVSTLENIGMFNEVVVRDWSKYSLPRRPTVVRYEILATFKQQEGS